MQYSARLSLLPALIASAFPLYAADTTDSEHYTATLPTVTVVGHSDTSVLKGYINYDEATVTRNGQLIKETPQTVDTLNIQKNKNYGTNDLSSILEGNAGIDAAYDMRGESIFLRGFQADASDIYRDGVRESGQVRRSTANIERVEILKGPSSVLYGRTNGGGVINMVSKYANFKQSRNIGAVYGSWANRSLNMDINEVLNKNVAIRLTGEVGRANSFRSGIDSKNVMVSPSITVKLDNGLKWTGQYTYDNVERTPDRSPTKSVYDRFGLPYRMGFAHRTILSKTSCKFGVPTSNTPSTTNGAPNGSSPTARRRRISTISMQAAKTAAESNATTPGSRPTTKPCRPISHSTATTPSAVLKTI